MNALELADGLDEDGYHHCANMIRTQQEQLNACRESKKEDVAEIYKLQAEIEVLKKEFVVACEYIKCHEKTIEELRTTISKLYEEPDSYWFEEKDMFK